MQKSQSQRDQPPYREGSRAHAGSLDGALSSVRGPLICAVLAVQNLSSHSVYLTAAHGTAQVPTELAKMPNNGWVAYLNFEYNTLCGDLPTEVTSISSSYAWYLGSQAGNGIGTECPPDPTPFPTISTLPTTLPTSSQPTLLPTTPVPSPLPTTEPTPLPTTEPTPVPTTPVPSPLPTTEPTPLPSPVPTPHDDREYLDRNADKKMLRKVKHVHSKEKREALKIAKEAKASMASH